MDEENDKVEKQDMFFGDKFTRMILGSVAGFIITLIVEQAYDKFIVERRTEDDTKN
jgi:hypothetical protein